MSDIEKTKPIDVLASRVWSGTHWHYPHIETMIAEIERLRKLYDAAWAECEDMRDRYPIGPSTNPGIIDVRIAHDAARKENTNGN
jgi:hypothetical protein